MPVLIWRLDDPSDIIASLPFTNLRSILLNDFPSNTGALFGKPLFYPSGVSHPTSGDRN
jgi:hypothetical protein